MNITKNKLTTLLNDAYNQGKNDAWESNYLEWKKKIIKKLFENES